MHLHALDWAVVALYVAFALGVGIVLARRAGKDVDEFFLSGRTLPWWVAGTSMVATTFAVDTPLAVTGWVRDAGIWRNWLWWCYASGGALTIFLFSRWWRRGGVMTKAEIAELRYGGREARILRGFLGALHAGVTNTIVLCWVLLAASKVMDVLLDVDKDTALVVACVLAMTYSLLAGFWGVVLTDLLQFAMAMAGSIALAWLAWESVGGAAGALSSPEVTADVLRLVPPAGDGPFLSAAFWTAPVAITAVYMGLQWWASDGVDGSSVVVQRIAASRDERSGVLAALWFNVANYALRPWPWILVGLASLVVFPHLEARAPFDGTVESAGAEEVVVRSAEGELVAVPLPDAGGEVPWRAKARVAAGDAVAEGAVLGRTDSERAYVAMMVRYLPVGLLGLVVASLLAAFMSTVDTHVNLAASFFVNDVYRRFAVRDASPTHYVLVARIASVVVLGIGGLFASQQESISDLFLFFTSFLAGVGPVYVLRWLWWRVTAWAEIAAMAASGVATTAITLWRDDVRWSLGPLSPGGELLPEGRLVLVVSVSLATVAAALALGPRADPRALVGFYRRVRPFGAWGPVRELAGTAPPRGEAGAALLGAASALAAIYAAMFGTGHLLLGRHQDALVAVVIAALGVAGVRAALRRLARSW